MLETTSELGAKFGQARGGCCKTVETVGGSKWVQVRKVWLSLSPFSYSIPYRCGVCPLCVPSVAKQGTVGSDEEEEGRVGPVGTVWVGPRPGRGVWSLESGVGSLESGGWRLATDSTMMSWLLP